MAPFQFYDKFNIRHNIAELLEYLWRKIAKDDENELEAEMLMSNTVEWESRPAQDKDDEKGVYVNFLNFLINDNIYLLNESLKKILELREIEAEMSNTVEWESRPGPRKTGENLTFPLSGECRFALHKSIIRIDKTNEDVGPHLHQSRL
ncbi:hypothetical protein OROGR_022391 [Orobanche gracilis]